MSLCWTAVTCFKPSSCRSSFADNGILCAQYSNKITLTVGNLIFWRVLHTPALSSASHVLSAPDYIPMHLWRKLWDKEAWNETWERDLGMRPGNEATHLQLGHGLVKLMIQRAFATASSAILDWSTPTAGAIILLLHRTWWSHKVHVQWVPCLEQ